MNDFICHPTATNRPKSQSKNHSPRLAQSSYIEATPADDEFRRNVQDLSDYRGIGAVAWGKHISGGSTTTEDTIKQGPMQISSPLPQTVPIQSHLPRREAKLLQKTRLSCQKKRAADAWFYLPTVTPQWCCQYLILWTSFNRKGSTQEVNGSGRERTAQKV